MATTPTPPSSSGRGRLLKILGVGFGLAVAIGNTIAAGILRTPGEIAARLPNEWVFLAVWVVGALYALVSAVPLAELGAMLPRSGGQYIFAHRALGPYAGFIVGWSDWLSLCGTVSAVAIVVGEYSGKLFPALDGRTTEIATAVAVLFGVLQWRGLRWGQRTQELTALLKGLAFVAVVAACFLLGSRPAAAPQHAALAMPAGLGLFAALVVSLQAVIYTYDGWDAVVYFCEEVRNPGRDIPRAMFGSVISIMGIYLLVNAAVLYLVPIRDVAGNPFALGLAANSVFGARGGDIVLAVMLISLVSSVNACQLMATRVIFAMSRDGLVWDRITRVNRGGTPAVALFATVAAAVLFIVTNTFETVIALLAFFFVANYTISFISLFVLRRKEPELPRPYRAWGHPWTTGLALAGSIAFLGGAIGGDWTNARRSLLLLAASYPAYRLLKWLAARKASS